MTGREGQIKSNSDRQSMDIQLTLTIVLIPSECAYHTTMFLGPRQLCAHALCHPLTLDGRRWVQQCRGTPVGQLGCWTSPQCPPQLSAQGTLGRGVRLSHLFRQRHGSSEAPRRVAPLLWLNKGAQFEHECEPPNSLILRDPVSLDPPQVFPAQ